MNRDQLQEQLTNSYQAYRRDLEDVANSPDLEQDERLEKARECHRLLVDAVSAAGRAWSEQLDERAGDLEKVLYHGGEKYRQAVRQLSDKGEQELEQTAKIASRTGDTDMVRAAAVVAREKGYHQLFYDYVAQDDEFAASYQELLEIPDHADREQYVRQFVPPAPGPQDVRPSQEEMRRREHERTMQQSARIQAEVNARREAGITLFPAEQKPRRFVGREQRS